MGGVKLKKVVLVSSLLLLIGNSLSTLAVGSESVKTYSEISRTNSSDSNVTEAVESEGEALTSSSSEAQMSSETLPSMTSSETLTTDSENAESSTAVTESFTLTEEQKIAELVAKNDLDGLQEYLKNPAKYQKVLAEILKTKNYSSQATLPSANLRAGKNKGVAEFMGISPERLLNKLKQHENDRYYLGTPFKGLWLPVAQNMSPLGNPNKYGPGFNCTGFVATVFKEAGARNSEITNRANAWGGIGNAYNWRDALLPNVEYYSYSSVNALLKGGKASKGDILYFEPNYSIPGYDPHIGFFWGNTPSHNRMWHSYDANIMSNIKAGRPWTKVYLFKLKQTKPKNEQGKYIPFGKHVQIKSKNYEIFKNFEWDVKNKSSKVYEHTFLAKGKYKHKNGSTYYSLYDSKDKWLGYINSGATRVTEPQGKAVSTNKYVTIKKKDYTVWSDFNWKKRYESDEKINQQFMAKVKYNHYNGATYYSLYDLNGKWHGYINSDAVSVDPDQGKYIPFGKHVQIKSKNYEIFNNFKWSVINKSSKVYEQTFLAKGKYQHKNGATYYSLYDSKDNWLGYINSGATSLTEPQGKALSFNKKVTIVKNDYTVWTDFNWTKRYESAEKLNQTFDARVKYNHYNGASYYSLYDSNGKWQGYINSNGTKLV